MGFGSKEERWRRVLRGVKTILFLIYMLASLLIFSAPVLLAIADAIIPLSLLSASLSSSSSTLSLQSLASHFESYDLRYSLIDIPLISIVRSALIICVYSLCDGPALTRGPYMGITTVCSVLSLAFVSLKASYVFGVNPAVGSSDHRTVVGGGTGDYYHYNYYFNENYGYKRGMEMALFVCSLGMAVAHVVVAYKTSCRERRKLLVYKIDIEAVRVTASKIGFPRYKILQEQRVK